MGPIPNHLVACEIRPPIDLALATRSDMRLMLADCPNGANFPNLRRASTHEAACASSSARIIPANADWCAEAGSRADSSRRRDINQSDAALSLNSAKSDLRIRLTFERAGRASKIRLNERGSAGRSSLMRCLNTGHQMNTLRQVHDSHRSVAVGVHCCASFCDMISSPYFPPTADDVLRWSTLFNPVRTFGLYIAHISKARQLLQIPPTWPSEGGHGP